MKSEISKEDQEEVKAPQLTEEELLRLQVDQVIQDIRAEKVNDTRENSIGELSPE